MFRKLGLCGLMATLLCSVTVIGFAGCDGGYSAPKPLAEYDEIKNDPELAAIAKSGKRPDEIRAAIKAKARSRQRAEVDPKGEAKYQKKAALIPIPAQ